MPTISRRVLANTVEARVKTLTGVTVYRGEITSTPPTISADNLRVKPYVILHSASGRPGPEEDLCGDDADLVWSFQLKCVAGYSTDCDGLVDRVAALFERWWIPIDSALTSSRCRQLNDLGIANRDDDVSPPRFWFPLVYVIHLGY